MIDSANASRPFSKYRTRLQPLGNYSVKGRGSIDPRKHQEEEFDLFSIPAYDVGCPERLKGSDIGSAKKLVEPGDVLISRIVPHIQRVWVVGKDAGRKQIASGEWIIFKGDDICPNYLRHVLLSAPFHAQFLNTVAGIGGSLLRARPAEVNRIEIPVPEVIGEQQRIAAILDKAHNIRRKHEQTLKVSADFLLSTYMHLVGHLNPKYGDWTPYPVEQLAADHKNSIRSGPFGSALLHSEFVDHGIAVLGIDNAVQNKFAWGERRFITEEKYEELRRYRVFPNDVIITIMGTTGRSAVVPQDIPEAITTKHLATITCNRALIHPEVLSFAIHSDPMVIRQIKARNKGAIMDGLNLGIIRDLRIKLPPMTEQDRFVEFLFLTRSIMTRLGDPKLDGSALFESLSQRAFRGEL